MQALLGRRQQAPAQQPAMPQAAPLPDWFQNPSALGGMPRMMGAGGQTPPFNPDAVQPNMGGGLKMPVGAFGGMGGMGVMLPQLLGGLGVMGGEGGMGALGLLPKFFGGR